MRTTISPTNHKVKLAVKYSGLKCEYTSLLKKKEIIKEQMASFTICKGSRIYHISLKTKIALMVGVLWHVNSDRKKYLKVYKKKLLRFQRTYQLFEDWWMFDKMQTLYIVNIASVDNNRFKCELTYQGKKKNAV